MSILGKVFSAGAGKLVENVGGILDNLTTTKEEKLEAQRLITEILQKADTEAQEQVSARWAADMASDNKLSKNIRPMVLIYLTVIFTACAFFDGNIGQFKIAEEYIPIFQTLLVTVYGAYFVGRSWEKTKQIIKNK